MLPGVRDGVAGRERGGVEKIISWGGEKMVGVLIQSGSGGSSADVSHVDNVFRGGAAG
jgi:hypothetical protein